MDSSVHLLELLREANCRIGIRRNRIMGAIMDLAMEVVNGAVAAGVGSGKYEGRCITETSRHKT